MYLRLYQQYIIMLTMSTIQMTIKSTFHTRNLHSTVHDCLSQVSMEIAGKSRLKSICGYLLAIITEIIEMLMELQTQMITNHR